MSDSLKEVMKQESHGEKGLDAGGIDTCGGAILFRVCTGLRDWTIRLVLLPSGAAAWRVVP